MKHKAESARDLTAAYNLGWQEGVTAERALADELAEALRFLQAQDHDAPGSLISNVALSRYAAARGAK